MGNESSESGRIAPVDPLYEPAWYAVYTKSRHEQVVFDQLVAKRLEAFLPKVEVWSRRTDRRKRIEIPMFPGYMFVRTTLHPDRHLAVLKTVGLVNMVCSKGSPVPVNPDEIASLKILIASGEAIHPVESYEPGDLVRITEGPFKGVVGRLIGRKAAQKLIVEVQTISRAVSVEVDDHMVIKAEPY